MKNNNQFTINLNDDYKLMLQELTDYHQRKTADYLRIILQPVIQSEYIKMQNEKHPSNNDPMQQAIYKK